MMPSVDLPNNGNVWQTTEPVKGRPTMYQQVISIIGKLNHRILPAQVTSLSFETSLFFPVKLQSSNCRLPRRFTHHPRVTKARAALHPHVCTRRTYTISYARLLSKLTPSNNTCHITPDQLEQTHCATDVRTLMKASHHIRCEVGPSILADPLHQPELPGGHL